MCDVRELVQFAALFLVDGFELLMLHPQPLLLQHDLLVEAVTASRGSCCYLKALFKWFLLIHGTVSSET